VPYQVFATRDGHIVLAIGNDGQFARFCQLAGHDEVARDPRYLSNDTRIAHRDELIATMSPWLQQRSTAEWTELLEPNAVPCAPILAVPEVFKHPQVLARGMQIGKDGMPMVATPMRFDGQRPVAEQPPPRLDEHGDEIRRGSAWRPR
jgi:crotonobetainyl-CoA:carnitine CoA-transferase CaiB-like acyl-CoA transferase